MEKTILLIKKIIAIIFLMAVAFFLFSNAPYFKPTEKFEKDVLRVVVDDKDVTNSLPNQVYVENNVVMMSSETAMKFFDNIYVYYDSKYNTAIITSEKNVGKIEIGKNIININGEDKELAGTACFNENELYIPISLIEEITDVDVDYNEKVIATTLRGRSRAKVVRSSAKQNLKTYKRNITMNNGKVNDAELMYVFDTEGKTDNDYITVRNIRGDIGYIKFDEIQVGEIISLNQGTGIQEKDVYDEMKFCLAWEYAENYTPDRTDEGKNSALDIISPTWLYLSNGQGDLKVTTDDEYLNWAKEKNYRIWPTLKNDFTSLDEVSNIMNDMKLREKFINNVVDYALEKGFHGINIDFENMYKEDKDVFSQFVREISADLRRNGLIVSIDVTIPGGSDTYSLCYDRAALSKSVDFVMLMAYDQYGTWSSTAGPVASISWVERNIKEMLGYEGVDKDKLFLCVPFYSRYWVVNSETNKVKTSRAIDMKTANSYLEKYSDNAVWSQEDGQYYIEFTSNGATTKIWIENEEALEKKIELINKYDLAGVAIWRWGYEDSGVWNVINDTMNIQ